MRLANLLVVSSLSIASLAGCSSPPPVSGEIAREGAETNALIEAAKGQIEAASATNDFGKPLPPLRGVDTPLPAKNPNSSHHEHHSPPEKTGKE